MKLYIQHDLRNQNLNKYNKKERTCSFLISDEGIFTVSNTDKTITKVVIKKDVVENFKENEIDFILDKSIVELIKYDKVPYIYTRQEYNEEIFIVNDHMNIVCVNNKVWYIEFNSAAHLTQAKQLVYENV
tara:strand:- start:768 stop:1157 length:390 start_codon:yes stop_codon:yes gene_type:complete